MEAFFVKDAWLGGFYELALEYQAQFSACLEEALKTIWNHPGVQGCYLRRDVGPSAQERIAPALTVLESGAHLLGTATLPQGKLVVCGTYLVHQEQGSVWLGFYVPMGSLGKDYDVGAFPFAQNDSSHEWRKILDEWMAGIGQAVFARAPFSLGLVGLEVSGEVSAREVAVSGVPDKRSLGYLYPVENRLLWFPANQWQQLPAVMS